MIRIKSLSRWLDIRQTVFKTKLLSSAPAYKTTQKKSTFRIVTENKESKI